MLEGKAGRTLRVPGDDQRGDLQELAVWACWIGPPPEPDGCARPPPQRPARAEATARRAVSVGVVGDSNGVVMAVACDATLICG